MFNDPLKLVLGLVTGIVFGVLLQKGQVAKFQKILGQFLLKDFTVVKIMATGIAVGTIGVHALVALVWRRFTFRRLRWRASLSAACSSARVSRCSGSSVAACGEGRRDAMVGVLGMFVGAGIYVAAFPALQPMIKSMADFGKVTLPQFTGTSPWLWAGGLAVVTAIALAILERVHPKRLDATP